MCSFPRAPCKLRVYELEETEPGRNFVGCNEVAI